MVRVISASVFDLRLYEEIDLKEVDGIAFDSDDRVDPSTFIRRVKPATRLSGGKKSNLKISAKSKIK